MRNRVLLVLGGLFLVAGCGGAAEPAAPPVTTTVTAPAVTQTLKVTAAAAAPATMSSDKLACGVILKALDYVDGVKANYDKHDGSAPLAFLQETTQEAADTFDLVNGIYLAGEVDGGVEVVMFWQLEVAGLQSQTIEGSPASIEALANYLGAAKQLRTACVALS